MTSISTKKDKSAAGLEAFESGRCLAQKGPKSAVPKSQGANVAQSHALLRSGLSVGALAGGVQAGIRDPRERAP